MGPVPIERSDTDAAGSRELSSYYLLAGLPAVASTALRGAPGPAYGTTGPRWPAACPRPGADPARASPAVGRSWAMTSMPAAHLVTGAHSKAGGVLILSSVALVCIWASSSSGHEAGAFARLP